MTEINLANLTDTETADLATRCLDILPLADKVQAVLKSFHSTEEREELQSWLENEPEEDED